MSKDITVPYDLDTYIGQESLKRKLRVYVDQAHKTGGMLPHMLFASDPGCGKTTLAYSIGNEVGDLVTKIDLSKMRNDDLANFLFYDFEGGILFCDEIDKARPNQQRDLLELAEEGILVSGGMTIEVPMITLILATTRPEKVEVDLVSRMQFKPRWERYTDEEMTAIILQMAEDYTEISPRMAATLAKATGGTPRCARDMVRAYDALGGNDEVRLEDVLDMVDIDADGLTGDHKAYLQALLELGGTAGEGRIANQMRAHVTVVRRLERLLYERSYIRAGSSGRTLTAAGRAKLGVERKQYTRRKVS